MLLEQKTVECPLQAGKGSKASKESKDDHAEAVDPTGFCVYAKQVFNTETKCLQFAVEQYQKCWNQMAGTVSFHGLHCLGVSSASQRRLFLLFDHHSNPLYPCQLLMFVGSYDMFLSFFYLIAMALKRVVLKYNPTSFHFSPAAFCRQEMMRPNKRMWTQRLSAQGFALF